MPGDLPFACTCGKVSGTLAAKAVARGTRATCGCKDCRAAVKHLTGKTVGQVEIFLTSPHHIKVETGFARLSALNLSPKGPHRIYATCCNATIATVPRSPRLGFASVTVDRFVQPSATGPVKSAFFRTEADGKRHLGLPSAISGIVARGVRAQVSGGWKRSAFHGADGQIAVPVDLIAPDAKALAYDA